MAKKANTVYLTTFWLVVVGGTAAVTLAACGRGSVNGKPKGDSMLDPAMAQWAVDRVVAKSGNQPILGMVFTGDDASIDVDRAGRMEPWSVDPDMPDAMQRGGTFSNPGEVGRMDGRQFHGSDLKTVLDAWPRKSDCADGPQIKVKVLLSGRPIYTVDCAKNYSAAGARVKSDKAQWMNGKRLQALPGELSTVENMRTALAEVTWALPADGQISRLILRTVNNGFDAYMAAGLRYRVDGEIEPRSILRFARLTTAGEGISLGSATGIMGDTKEANLADLPEQTFAISAVKPDVLLDVLKDASQRTGIPMIEAMVIHWPEAKQVRIVVKHQSYPMLWLYTLDGQFVERLDH